MTFLTLAQSQQHVYGFEGTGAASLFMVGFTVVLILAALLIRINLRLLVIGGMLFATALTAPVDFINMQYIPTWMLSVQKLRAEIHLGLGVLLTLMVMVPGRIAVQHVSAQSMFMLIIGLFMALMMYVHADAGEATQSVLFALATIPCMVAGIPALTRTDDQCIAMLRCIMFVSAVWTFCCSVQFVINPKYLVNNGGRFWGMLGNAQQAAILVAPFCVISLWLILNDPVRRNRILWIGLLAINLLFLMWTGSRTGLLMLVLGTMAVLSTRIGKAIALLPVAALLFFGLWYLSDLLQIGSSVERLVSNDDTRHQVWTHQLEAALSSPLIGVGWNENVGGSESSYFGGFAAYGIGFLLLILAFVFFSIGRCAYLLRNRRVLSGTDRTLVDIFIGFNAAYFGGAAFEGYLLARSSTTMVMMLMFAGIGTYLKERIAQAHAGEQVLEYDYVYEEEHGQKHDTAAAA
jgi:hypothetical protein